MLQIKIMLLATISLAALGSYKAYGGRPSVLLNTDVRMLDGQAPIQLTEKESQKLLAAIDRGRLRSDELVKQGKIGLGEYAVAPYMITIRLDGKELTYLLSSRMFFANKSVFLTDAERKWLHELFETKGIQKPEQAGADQPATKPADKPPVKVQPSPPTPKVVPR